MHGKRLALLKDILYILGFADNLNRTITLNDLSLLFRNLETLSYRTGNKAFSYSDRNAMGIIRDSLKNISAYRDMANESAADELISKYKIYIPPDIDKADYLGILLIYAFWGGSEIVKRDKRKKPCPNYVCREVYTKQLINKLILGEKCVLIGSLGSGKSQLLRDFLSNDTTLPSIKKICPIRYSTGNCNTYNIDDVLKQHTCHQVTVLTLDRAKNKTSKSLPVLYSEDSFWDEENCLYIIYLDYINDKDIKKIDSISILGTSSLLVMCNSGDGLLLDNIRNKKYTAKSTHFLLLSSDFNFLSNVYDGIISMSNNSSRVELDNLQKEQLFSYCGYNTFAVSTIAQSLMRYSMKYSEGKCKSQIARILDPYSGLFRTSGMSTVRDTAMKSDIALTTFLCKVLTPFMDAENSESLISRYSEQLLYISLFVRGSWQSISLIAEWTKDRLIEDAAYTLESINLAIIKDGKYIFLNPIISDIIWEFSYHKSSTSIVNRYIRYDIYKKYNDVINRFLNTISLRNTYRDETIYQYIYDSAVCIYTRAKNERPYLSKTNKKHLWENTHFLAEKIREFLALSGNFCYSNQLNHLSYKAEDKNGYVDIATIEQNNQRYFIHIENQLFSGASIDSAIEFYNNKKTTPETLYYPLIFALDFIINQIDAIALIDKQTSLFYGNTLLEELIDKSSTMAGLVSSSYNKCYNSENDHRTAGEYWQKYYLGVFHIQRYLYSKTLPVEACEILNYKHCMQNIVDNENLPIELRIRTASDLYRYLGLYLLKYGETNYVSYGTTLNEYSHHMMWITQTIQNSFISFNTIQIFNASLIIFNIISTNKENLCTTLDYIRITFADRYRPIDNKYLNNILNTIDNCKNIFSTGK